MVRLVDLAVPAERPGTLPPDVDDRACIIKKLIASDALVIAEPVYTRIRPAR